MILENIKNIISSIKLIILNKQDKVNTIKITDLKHRIRIRFEQINEINIFLKKGKKTIACELGISKNTVKKYCEGAHVPWERKE